MIKRFFLLLLLLASAALAQEQAAKPRLIKIPAKRALTHETLWLMPRVGSPTPSPDGKWVVFSINKPAYDEKEASSDLWLVPAEGGAEPRQITFSKSAESDVTWSPDSRRIAFSAKREGDEQTQIYLLDLGGGEARRVTNISTGARSPQFRPDGNAILFTSVVYPGAMTDADNKRIAKERREQKYKVRTYTGFPIRHWDRWLDDMQIHLFVQGFDAETTAHDLLAGTKLVQEPGFGGRTAEGSRDEIDAAWSPDGQSIVFAVSTNRNVSAYAESGLDLYRIAVQGGATPELIAHAADGSYVRPRFSPDGKSLYAVYNANNGKLYNLDRLVRYDWPSMQNRKVLTGPPFDRSAGNYAFTPDSQTIYFTAEEAGLEKVFRVSASGGDAQLAVDPGRGVYSRLMIAEKAPALVMTALWGSSINPAEVVRIDPAKKSHANLTEINVVTANNLDWLAPEHFWFTSKRGKKIHNMVVRPPAFDEAKKYPLFVVIHGGPASMFRDEISLRWNYHLLAKPGYVVLLTNYTGSTGFGEKFAQDIQGDPLKGPGDEINEAADEAIKRYPFIDATRQAAGGASYGGHLANWLEATTTRYKCLISHAGLVNIESQYATSDGIYHRELMNLGPPWEQGKVWREQNPIRFAAHFKTPILLSVGERDMRVPANNTIENWSALQRMRVPSRLLVWPDENHWILNPENSRHWYGEVWDWLGKWLS
jgi:dipeptidyl aminopeptidase/acylaminoacyl peptidase